jgi:hypothetical protein
MVIEAGPKPLRRRLFLKATMAAALLTISAVVLSWLHYGARHKLLRALTVAESFFEGEMSESGGSGPVPEPGAIPFYIHAGRAGREFAPCSEASMAACAREYRRVEVDVSFSSDLVPYLSHGDNLSAVTGEPMEHIGRYSAEQLDRLVLTDGSRLLRFEKFASGCARDFEHTILDIKTSHQMAQEKAAVLSGLLGSRVSGRYMVISTSGPFLSWFRRLQPGIPVGCESYLALSSWLAGFQLASRSVERVGESGDIRARRFGLKRVYWTAWTEKGLERMLSWHPEFIVVDLGGERPPQIPARWRKMGQPR